MRGYGLEKYSVEGAKRLRIADVDLEVDSVGLFRLGDAVYHRLNMVVASRPHVRTGRQRKTRRATGIIIRQR